MTGESRAEGGHLVTVAEAMERLPGPGGERFAKVLGHGSMEVEIYASCGNDSQESHFRDELYFMVSGSGEFVNGPGRHPFGSGDARFTRADASGRL